MSHSTSAPVVVPPTFGGTTTLAPSFLLQIVDGLAEAESLWRPHLALDPTDRGKVRLVATDVYEVWLLGWMPGQGVDLHDHGGANAAFRVVDGALVELEVDHGAAGRVLRRRTLPTGSTRRVPSGVVHDVLNVSSAPAASIHAYSPPLRTMGFYDPVDLTPTRTEPVRWVDPVLPHDVTARATHPTSAVGS